MKPRKKNTLMLTLLIVASLLSVIASVAEAASVKEQASRAAPSDHLEKAKPQAAVSSEGKEDKQLVIAYYFHGNRRCRTCRTIETYAHETIQKGFKEQIEKGRLQWKVVNLDAPENEHYVEDFQLVTRSLVLQEVMNGSPERWKNLNRVWELVRDREAFQQYVQEETRAFLEGRGQ